MPSDDRPVEQITRTHADSHSDGLFCVIAASNDEDCLKRNLLSSEMIRSGRVPLHVERGALSAAQAYNSGLDATRAPIVIFAHQDTYFPPGWDKTLGQALDVLQELDRSWALLAPFGISVDDWRLAFGPVWSSSLGQVIGHMPEGFQPVQSFDELAFVMRRDAGLRFDEGLPGFHLHGLDMAQSAWTQGLGAYVTALPLVHNDVFHGVLRRDFSEAYHYLRRKWRHRLPLYSPVLRLSRHGLDLPLQRLRMLWSFKKRRRLSLDSHRPGQHYSRACNWE